MTTSLRKKVFLLMFCLASVAQGMYSTYFVSILTTIERIYHIRSKTAGAILSATELGQIVGSLLIAYYGGRGNKPKWIAACMILSASAALISITPHVFLIASSRGPSMTASNSLADTESMSVSTNLPYAQSDLNSGSTPSSISQSSTSTLPAFLTQPRIDLPGLDQLCHIENFTEPSIFNTTGSQVTSSIHSDSEKQSIPVGLILAIFYICLLVIGFGSTALTTLGIPLIDDILSKEESPFYLGLTIGLRVSGPALGFLLGSVCIRLPADTVSFSRWFGDSSTQIQSVHTAGDAWWLGLVIISLPLLLLSFPMHYVSRMIESNMSEPDDFEDITYQAAEDHDIGGSHDFPAHILGFDSGGLDVTSNRTCFSSEIDSSSREVLQARKPSSDLSHRYNNYARNIALKPPTHIREKALNEDTKSTIDIDERSKDEPEVLDKSASINSGWRANICVVVNHFGRLESTSFTNDDACEQSCRATSSAPSPSSSSSSSSSIQPSVNSTTPSYTTNVIQQHKSTLADLSSSLSRLIQNKLLLLRMLSGILHILPIAGFYTFLPKYLIEQFRITSSSASVISGLAGILFVGLGAFLGGTIVRVFNINSRLMTKWIALSALLYALGMLVLMNLGCAQNQTVYYGSQDFISTDCSMLCKCSDDIYNPVCANGTTYISPCLAGCKSYSLSENKILFDECGCVAPQASQGTNLTTSEPSMVHVNLNVATQGHCIVNCDNLKWYIIIFSISTLIHASCEVGSMMFNLRCVKSNDRTMALGLITFSSSLFGTIPCSVIYGTIVDLTCVHWDSIAGQSGGPATLGACQAYKNDSFRYYLHGLTALVMFFAFLVDLIVSTRANEVDFYDGYDSRADAREELKKSTETI